MMKTLLTLLVLLFSSSVFSDDIADFQIEGVSIGDSLLDYMSEDEIISEIEWSKNWYYYKNNDFAEIYYFKKGEIYEYLSFLIKPNDKNYLIYGIYGNLNNDIEECLKMKTNIVKEFELMFPSANKKDSKFSPSFDKTGKSKIYYSNFQFNMKDQIRVECYDYSEDLEDEGNVDGLSVSIKSHETTSWLEKKLD